MPEKEDECSVVIYASRGSAQATLTCGANKKCPFLLLNTNKYAGFLIDRVEGNCKNGLRQTDVERPLTTSERRKK